MAAQPSGVVAVCPFAGRLFPCGFRGAQDAGHFGPGADTRTKGRNNHRPGAAICTDVYAFAVASLGISFHGIGRKRRQIDF